MSSEGSQGSPRSARTKKKSHLAKLAARKKAESDDSASESGSRASLGDLRRHVLSKDLNNSNQYSREYDNDDYGYSIRKGRLPSEGTLDRFQSMNVNGSAINGSEEESESSEDIKGNKRDREQNSDGDDTRRDAGFRVKRKSLSKDDDSDSDDSEEEDKNLSRTFRRDADRKDIQDQYQRLLDTPETNSPVVRRRSPLTMRRSSLDVVEEQSTSDELPSDSFSAPRPSVLSPVPSRGHLINNDTAAGPSSIGGGYMDHARRPISATMTEFSENSNSSNLSNTSAFPPLTTKDARARSFLVGSMASQGSLLGTEELERFFPDRKMRVFIGTWNMCEMKKVPDSLDNFMLPESCDHVCDMYVMATQESTANRKEWEIRLQETLGPQHVLYHSANFGVLYMSVFLRRDLIWFCSVPEVASVGTRKFSAVKTKGGLGISFTIFGTSILLVNCHLNPHDGKMEERIRDYNKINAELSLPKEVNANTYSGPSDDVSSKFDVVFWAGDTNFRLLKPRGCVENAMQGIHASNVDQQPADYEDLIQHDELYQAKTQDKAFQDFQEGRIKFLPSYKYDIGTNNIDTSKLRVPSYTDRVLFRCKRKHAVTCVHYDAAHDVCDSDHKPVFGVYEVQLRPGRDTLKLCAGQFNREVWLEANQRRANSRAAGVVNKNGKPSSSVCTIM